MSSESAFSAVEIIRRLAERRAQRVGYVSSGPSLAVDVSALEPFLNSAAVLACFDPETLQPKDAVTRTPELTHELLSQSVQVVDERGKTVWVLRPEVRSTVLSRLKTRAALLAALNAIPEPQRHHSQLQAIFELLLKGTWDYIQFKTEQDLIAAIQSAGWLEGVLADIPPLTELRARLARIRMLAPFERLAGKGFYGRSEELQKLRDYVGIGDISFGESVKDKLRNKQGYMVLFGPGGVGKSTLLAKFVLEQVQISLSDRRFPILYFDLDDASFLLGQPDSMLPEAVRQLALQYSQANDKWTPGKPPSDIAGSRAPGFSNRLSVARPSATTPLSPRFLWGVEQFCRFLRECLIPAVAPDASPKDRPPLLIILDSLEEAAYRNVHIDDQVLRLLQDVQCEYAAKDGMLQEPSQLRTLIAGRALDTICPKVLESAWDKPLNLTGFDEDAGTGYLISRGVTDPDVARAVARQLSGNPLSLHLAASVLQSGDQADVKGLRDLKTNTYLLFRVSEEVIQGQLFMRILSHIRNPDVRRLAHPGLALRRITTVLIDQVLSEPCELSLPTDATERAQRIEELFQGLRDEVALVVPEPGNAVRHRSDVRHVMLDLLRRERPEQFEEINRRAVDYYQKHAATADDYSELVYHMLQLNYPARQVEPAFRRANRTLLDDALPELPPRGQLYLAAKLHKTLRNSEELERQASLEDWEVQAAAQVQTSMQRGDFARALSILAERTERSQGSPLYFVEAQLAMQLSGPVAAEPILRRGIDSAAISGDRFQNVRLLGLLASILLQTNRLMEAEDALAQAEGIARDLRQKRLLLNILTMRAEVAGRLGRVTSELDAELAQLISGLSDEQILAIGEPARPAIWRAASEKPALLVRGLELLGVHVRGTSGPPPEYAEKIPNVLGADWSEREMTRLYRTQEGRAAVAAKLGEALRERPSDEKLHGVADAMFYREPPPQQALTVGGVGGGVPGFAEEQYFLPSDLADEMD